MQIDQEHPELEDGDGNVFLIDRFQMGRVKLKEYFVRDQFSEEKHPLGQTVVYFWQNGKDENSTIKVSATITDSNDKAHLAMDHFMSTLANPSVFFETTEGHLRSDWLKKVEAVKVHMDSRGTELIAAAFIWGNIFFYIHSGGEQDHSIKKFIDNIGDYWSFIEKITNHLDERKNDIKHLTNFELSANKTDLTIGEVATLSKKGLNNEGEYSSFIYVAFPKKAVELYKENNVFKLKIKPSASNTVISPRVILIAVRPNGENVRSNSLKFTVKPAQ